ncbi:hypothetical protein BDV09DRAFT_186557 [Aspergillus tetrazonus]
MHLIPVGLLALTAQLGLVLCRPMGDGASESGEVTPEWTFSMPNTYEHSADLRRDRNHDAAMMGPSTNENEKVPDWSLETGMVDTAPTQPNTDAARMISPDGNMREKTPDWTLGMGADMDSEQTDSNSKMMDSQNLKVNVKRQTVVPIPSSSVPVSPSASPTASTTTSPTPSPTDPSDYGSYGEYGNYGDYASYGDYDGAILNNKIRQCNL